MNDLNLELTPIPLPDIGPAKMRVTTPGSVGPGFVRRAVLIVSGAYNTVAGIIWVNMGNGYSVPLYLSNAAPGLTDNILLHNSDIVPVDIPEFSVPLLAGGSITLHSVSF